LLFRQHGNHPLGLQLPKYRLRWTVKVTEEDDGGKQAGGRYGALAWTRRNKTSGEFMALKKRSTKNERQEIHARPAEKI
jgi:hypothetical protein